MINTRIWIIILFLLSLFFVLLSFSPSIYETYRKPRLSPERVFVLEHNYMFDYNFYLSRIREGQEGRWMVVEKYYNQPHQGSLIQILYLALGKIGGILHLDPPFIYHTSRLIFGFILLLFVSFYVQKLFKGWWSLIAFLFVVTAGSWPIIIKIGGNYRFATYMGWWSAVDSLQRITFIPHVLFGQIFMLLFIWRFSVPQTRFVASHKPSLSSLAWGLIGFLVGIVFPPTLIVVYTVFGILSILELSLARSHLARLEWFKNKIMPRLVFIFLSFPSLIYLKKMFQVMPWSALALFDIAHRTGLPYREYVLALGPVLPLGLAGMVLVLIKKEKKLFASIAWVLTVAILIVVFEKVPEQSPLRFTEAAVHIPLGILTTYLFIVLWQLTHFCKRSLVNVCRAGICLIVIVTLVVGLGVMGSMVLWLTDQARWKSEATYSVPIGAQLAYPLKDFMDGVYFIRDHTKREEVVLAYVTAGNFIPAYAGNYVYIGHANTPDEDGKEKIAAEFFSGKMKPDVAKEFIRRENISYIYFGPQERELGGVVDLASVYTFLVPMYSNSRVTIYKF